MRSTRHCAPGRTSSTLAGAVDVALHDVPAEAAVRGRRALEVHAAPGVDARERRHVEGLAHDVGREPVGSPRSTTVRHTPLTEIESPCAASDTALGARTREPHAVARRVRRR